MLLLTKVSEVVAFPDASCHYPLLICKGEYMAEVDENTVPVKAFEFANEIFRFLTLPSTWNDGWSVLIALATILCVVIFLFFLMSRAFASVLEATIKLVEIYKNSAFTVVWGTEKKKLVRQRKQFCSVLDADLAYIAKAENWNDQYFTDLEAEVETEGGYYTSAWNKIRKRRDFGLRRVSSLMRAIETSTERAVLLVGEPGSGKSVALRHLSKQMAENGKKSNSASCPIPLYINLRELEVPFGVAVNVDLIQQFVLENIRRGDADTSAFVQSHWNVNKENGIWFFLFDSFDEIPAVMHAATGSAAVRQYSEAIRQFLDGMGSCRSVLASREYKGPEALPWKKFRILPLGSDRQQKLVENSFLDDHQIRLVQQHLATDRSALGNNPLFLTLLCRFVKDVGATPTNDHQLLTSHIERLASREPDYIRRKYGLTSDELLVGARRLAVLFAENPTVSLAPRLDDIFEAMENSGITKDELQNLISALVDVKIGRNDVATARQGDRRFAFSHRRYQETLFANFLASNEGYLTPHDLLTQPQWREYAVTLLQIQTNENVLSILNCATEILNATASGQTAIHSVAGEAVYFTWENQPFTSVLSILQDSFVRRLSDVPTELSLAVHAVLSPRWQAGDHFDRFMVIKLGGLLPQAILEEYLGEALTEKNQTMATEAFRQCVYLRNTSDRINSLICCKLAEETLAANKSVEVLQLESLARQLPASVGAIFVFKRCVRLRGILSALNLLTVILTIPNVIVAYVLTRVSRGDLRQLSSKMAPKLRYRGGAEWGFALIIPLVLFGATAVSQYFELKISKPNSPDLKIREIMEWQYFLICVVAYCVAGLALVGVYKMRAEGAPVTFDSLISTRRFKSVATEIGQLCIAVIALIAAMTMPWLMGHFVLLTAEMLGMTISVESIYMEIGLPVAMAIFTGVSSYFYIVNWIRTRKALVRLRELRQFHSCDCRVLLEASGCSEAYIWLTKSAEFLAQREEDVRSASTLVQGYSSLKHDEYSAYPLFAVVADPDEMRKVKNSVGQRSLKLLVA